MTTVIDSDQHLYESRTLWADHIDPGAAPTRPCTIVDDELGYPWLTWRGQRLDVADVQIPGDTVTLGAHRQRLRAGPRPRSTTTTRRCPPTTGTRPPAPPTSTRWGSTKRWCSPTSGCCGSGGCRSPSTP